MVISYVHTFHAFGESSDTKPTQSVTEGMVFWELDTQKVYIFAQGAWKEIKAGTSLWSPTKTEEIENKTISLNKNTVKTTSGNIGLFGFVGGNFAFIPIGTANRYLKANNNASGFEFGDPAVSGSWNPSAAEILTQKTLVIESNTFKFSTPSNGAILVDNGTNLAKLVKGANNTFLGVDSNGVVGWYTVAGGGGGSGTFANSSLPSRLGYYEGWYGVTSTSNKYQASGILQDQLVMSESDTTITLANHNQRGRHLNIESNSSSARAKLYTRDKIFMREYGSYFLLRFRLDKNVPYDFFAGFTEDTDDDFNDPDDLTSTDCIMYCKRENDTKFSLLSNDGSSNYTTTLLNNFDTDKHTIEVQSVPELNKFQYRVDSIGGTWIDAPSTVPRTNRALGLVIAYDSETSDTWDLEIFDIEVRNKFI